MNVRQPLEEPELWHPRSGPCVIHAVGTTGGVGSGSARWLRTFDHGLHWPCSFCPRSWHVWSCSQSPETLVWPVRLAFCADPLSTRICPPVTAPPLLEAEIGRASC